MLLQQYPDSTLMGQDFGRQPAPGVTAPITEEVAKLCRFILLVGAAPRLIRIGLAFTAACMFFHLTWDDAVGLGQGGAAVFQAMLGLTGLSFASFLVAFRHGAPGELKQLRGRGGRCLE